jgi:putative transposase
MNIWWVEAVNFRKFTSQCLSRVILFGERSLRLALREYVEHFYAERNHQEKGNVLLFPRATARQREGPVRCHERLGGLLRYCHREAA